MNNKSLFSRLLQNKKVLLISSLILAFVFWIVSSDNISKTVSEISLNYSLPESIQNELKIYSVSTEKISVTVDGKRVVVDSLTADKFTASVDLSAVNAPGNNSYPITVKANSTLSMEISSFEPSSVTIMVDRPMTKTVELRTDFVADTDDEHYIHNNAPETVEITGPETYVNRVECAYISGDVKVGADSPTVTNTYHVTLVDDADNPKKANVIPTDYITMSYTDIDVTFRYLKLVDNMGFSLNLNPSGVSLPGSYYSVSPSKIKIAGPETLLSGDNPLKSIPLDIDLWEYRNEDKEVKINLTDVLDNKIINMSNGIEEVTVSLKFSSLSAASFDVPSSRIVVKNIPQGYAFSPPSYFSVTAIGTESALENLKNTDFTIEYDFGTDKPTSVNVEVPVTVTVSSSELCWVYLGESNLVNVQLSQID